MRFRKLFEIESDDLNLPSKNTMTIKTDRLFRVYILIHKKTVSVWEPLIADELNDPDPVHMEPGEIISKLYRAVRQFCELFDHENDESVERTIRKAERIMDRIDDLLDELSNVKRDLFEEA